MTEQKNTPQLPLEGFAPSAMPSFVSEIILKLEAAGHEAFAVGGCVRDLLLGRQITDYDITTSALWPQVEVLFAKTLPTGSRFGSGTVIMPEGSAQVTTYRIEQGYRDKRRPDSVTPVGNLAQDLQRRDFTINTICWHPQKGLVDLLDGCTDLRRGLIRCVGDPNQRFGEDALRILRAFRFSCQLGFTIQEQTLAAGLQLAETLRWVSAERITQEIDKILLSPRPSLAAPLLAEVQRLWGGNPISDLAPLDRCPLNLAARYAALLELTGWEPALLAKQIRLPSKLLREIQTLHQLLGQPASTEPAIIKAYLRKAGQELFFVWLELVTALTGAEPTAVKAAALDILQKGEPYDIPHLAISGSDLIALGVTGPAVGQLLEQLLEQVMSNPQLNNRQSLLAAAQTILKAQHLPS